MTGEVSREVVLQAQGLGKEFNGFKVVRSVSFDLFKGEILGLLGPNGAGKTTIIHMILGLISPTYGNISVFGWNPQKRSEREKILQRMNFSSTYVAMPYALTPEESLMVFAALYNVRNPRQKIKALLEQFDLREIAHKPVRTLSSGQMTRLNLAKAFINDPEILLLDEPTASLDPVVSVKVRTFLKELKEHHKTSILYTSHNMKEMEEMCDRVIFLHKGEIIAEGRPETMVSSFDVEDLEEVFVNIVKERMVP